MKKITLPLVGGTTLTLFIGAGGIAVSSSTKEPNTCRLQDGNHNNGGWHIALSALDTISKIDNLCNPKFDD
jgi:hypothetical protein